REAFCFPYKPLYSGGLALLLFVCAWSNRISGLLIMWTNIIIRRIMVIFVIGKKNNDIQNHEATRFKLSDLSGKKPPGTFRR
ncbi:MAG: hypothetical protein LBE13_10145, partial [Bacteroidales bacterium]|nr:hypothetical protein [Bacteroidales bacterium]